LDGLLIDGECEGERVGAAALAGCCNKNSMLANATPTFVLVLTAPGSNEANNRSPHSAASGEVMREVVGVEVVAESREEGRRRRTRTLSAENR